jgi:hypothetical protein
MFLKSEVLKNMRVSSLLSLVANRAWYGLSASQTGDETQWNSNDLGVVRVHQGTPRFYLLLLLLLLSFEQLCSNNFGSETSDEY